MNEEERKAYLEGQDKFGAKKGDTVFIFRKAKTEEAGWCNCWVSEMDEAVNKSGTILDICINGFDIKIPGMFTFVYPYFVLRLK